jgi:hypothetical protein
MFGYRKRSGSGEPPNTDMPKVKCGLAMRIR